MRKWIFFTIALWGLWLLPLAGREAQVPTRLLEAAQALGIDAHAFYVQAEVALPEADAAAALRLAKRAAREWPTGEVHLTSGVHDQRLVLAATCPPNHAQAQSIAHRMRNILGRDATVAYCLTGRTTAEDLERLAEGALRQLDDAPQEGLREPQLVSLTGAHVQVALRRDGAGTQVFLADPLVPMDY